MAIRIYKKEESVTSNWTGGTTTQLYISPANADLNARNFDFRISTATIEQEESKFTFLPGYKRILMVLEGQLLLKHVGHHILTLNSFEQDSFSGEWETIGIGKVTDFNLMYRSNFKMELYHLQLLNKNDEHVFKQKNTFVYIYKGSGEILGQTIVEGELLEIKESDHFVFTSSEPSILIVVERKIE